ncbi:hypothetical protein BJV82DRAFT_273901 [Fennellomyces sp. T-0311]|nr:hypothetical protein BJV82DRAFT_273901 [Fennellomyces sp. T-0311]
MLSTKRTVADADTFMVPPPQMMMKEDEQHFRNDLIEKATMRLRRRLLEERLSEVMRDVIQMQSQLEFLRVDASATIDAVSNIQDDDQNCRLEALERRLDAHRSQLDKLKNITPANGQDEEQQKQPRTRNSSSAFSMSRLSSLSLMSSLFSRVSPSSTRVTSRATSCYDDNDDDCMSVASTILSDTPEERQRRHRRRTRVKYHRQAQMSRTDNDSSFLTELKWNEKAPTMFPMPDQPYDNPRRNDGNDDDDDDNTLSEFDSMSSASSLSHPRALYDVIPDAASLLQQHHPLSPLNMDFDFLSDSYQFDRNVLDDALSFLDSMSDFADDGGFGEDMEFLLRHPDLCSRPLDEIRGTMVEFRRRESITVPAALYQYGAGWVSSLGYSACAKSVRWCKFLSILFAAVMISVLKGPQDMLD